MEREKLVSTTLLRERIQALEAEVEEQKKLRADDDPFFRIAEYFLTSMTDALREAEREYVPTAKAARLTGWSEQTLRARGRDVVEHRPLPPGWQDLLARFDGEWSFCVATIPVKDTQAVA